MTDGGAGAGGGAGFGGGAAYMLPASLSIAGVRSGDEDVSTRLPARNRSTIAAISCRSILPPATTVSFAVVTGCTTFCVATAGRALFTGLVSKATRLISIKWSGDTLSDVTSPPHEPQPNVIDGGNAVENPIAPCVVGVLTVIRDAGISAPNCTAASRERVWMPAVWPMPPNASTSWLRFAQACKPSTT